jgi:hypothetical protein
LVPFAAFPCISVLAGKPPVQHVFMRPSGLYKWCAIEGSNL